MENPTSEKKDIAAVDNEVKEGLATSNTKSTLQQQPYTINILQAPTRARMCGINTPLGKRILDPSLVVSLDFRDDSHDTGGVPEDIAMGSSSNTTTLPPSSSSKPSLNKNEVLFKDKVVCTVTLCDPDEMQSHSQCKSVKPLYARDGTYAIRSAALLIGQRTKTPAYLSISPGVKRHVFVFTDLSIRLSGNFRMKCSVINMTTGQIDTAFSPQFPVYVPQEFPGLDEPTALSKILYVQGVPLRAGLYHYHTGAVNGMNL